MPPAFTLKAGLVDAVLFTLVFGLGGGLVYGLLAWFESPIDLSSAVRPLDLLTINRTNVLVTLFVVGSLFGAVVGFGGWFFVELVDGELCGIRITWSSRDLLVSGLVVGLAGGLGAALSMTAWGQWVVLAHIWLPLAGRLPWAVVSFLDDAYQRGVLRQAGAVYQFRHARLQDHLART